MKYTLEEMVDYLKQGVELIGERTFTKPDDDWHPYAHIWTPDGQTGIVPLAFDSEEEKDIAANGIAIAAGAIGAHIVGFTLSAWAVTYPKGTDLYAATLVMPRNHPEREEIMTISVVSAKEQVFLKAPILRDPVLPPRLGEWERNDNNTAQGRFVDAVQKVLLMKERKQKVVRLD